MRLDFLIITILLVFIKQTQELTQTQNALVIIGLVFSIAAYIYNFILDLQDEYLYIQEEETKNATEDNKDDHLP